MRPWFVIVIVVASFTGCDLPPLPLFGAGDMADASTGSDMDGETIVCRPSTRICVGNAIRQCSADGSDFSLRSCDPGETCTLGTCLDILDTCTTGQPFSLSTNEITYDVTSDFKTQTKEVELSACSDRPVLIRSAVVRGPERPDGTPVFRLAAEFSQVLVPPGESVDVKIVYRPTPGLSHVEGRLELGLVTDELTNVEVQLRSKASCVAATALLDFGIVTDGDTPTRTGFVQNCGTEPIRLNRVLPGAIFGAVAGRELPHTLEAGDEMPFTVTMPARPELGAFEDLVRFDFEEATDVATTVRGFARRVDCLEIGVPTPQILVNNQPGTPRPGALVRLRFADLPEGQSQWAELISQPEGSFEHAGRITDGWLWRPRVVGTYEFRIRAIDLETSVASCKSTDLAIEVLPASRLHIELAWSSAGDSIPSDLGFGTGVNLDLHVLSSDGTTTPIWNDPRTDCFPGVIGACGVAGGNVATSQSGGIPEFAQFDDIDGTRFEIGAYLSNPFNFSGTVARARVFLDGELIGDLSSDNLQTANDFWLVGIYDGTNDSWSAIDRTFSGFPR